MEEEEINYCLPRTRAVRRILAAARIKPNPFKVSESRDVAPREYYVIDIDDAKKLRESGFGIVKEGGTTMENIFRASVFKARRAPTRRTRRARC